MENEQSRVSRMMSGALSGMQSVGKTVWKKIGAFLFVAVAAGVGTTSIIILLVALLGSGWSELGTGFITHDPEHVSAVDCNVMALDVHGILTTYKDSTNTDGSYGSETTSGEIAAYIDEAAEDSGIRAVLLDVDSTGGYPQAAREMVDALRESRKPSVAWIRGSGDSAAYWVASAATTIVASPQSDVGSIGVTSSYTDVSVQNEEQGITYNDLSTGKYKDTGTPDRALSSDERSYIEKQNKIMLDDFIREVALYRKMSEDAVRALADGSSLLGTQAKEAGLVDRLGTKKEALAALTDAIGEEPRLCWPQHQ